MVELRIKRKEHREVLSFLDKLEASLLAESRCYFGGGTRIVLELGEYRLSKDIDFLCSDQTGYRRIREEIFETSLGIFQKREIKLHRDIRADQYGIRSVIDQQGTLIKFEIIREGRIEIEGESVKGIPVKCLPRKYCFAEKLLANADRGVDTSTLNRDLIDLAFMAANWPKELSAGYNIAQAAYGNTVKHLLYLVLERFRTDKAHRNRCIESLDISETAILNKGLKKLASFVEKQA